MSQDCPGHLAPSLKGLLVAHHSLGNSSLLLVQERRAEDRYRQLQHQQGRVALLSAALTLLVKPSVNQKQACLAGL